MIRFKQKNFFLQFAGMAAMTALPMMQASKQGKEAKEQAEQSAAQMEKQNELIKQQNKQIEKLAKNNPQASAEFARIKQALYSIGSTLTGIGRAGKAAFGQGIKGNVALGLGIAGTSYAAGKYINHDMKKQGLDFDENGNLISTKSYSDPVTTNSTPKKTWKSKLGGAAFNTSMAAVMGGGMDLMNYHADKKMLNDQIAATNAENMSGLPQTAMYSVRLPRPKNKPKQKLFFTLNPMGAIRSIGPRFNRFKKNWKADTTGAISWLGTFGLGGTKSVQKFGEGLRKEGGTLGKVGNWIKKNPAGANLATALPLYGVASLSWDGTTKAANAIGNAIDPSAYSYKNAKEQAQNQMQQ